MYMSTILLDIGSAASMHTRRLRLHGADLPVAPTVMRYGRRRARRNSDSDTAGVLLIACIVV
jgi:hypothetical protein